ncbi:MAG: 16S rRNA (cytosine(1402)-N(4))-methyltransferase RsmH [Bacteroidetes bacterium]|nr:16S rRNA (cytosine(1402)-N(4))-methyltransferase RsmH [Bacteroidota bacterium]
MLEDQDVTYHSPVLLKEAVDGLQIHEDGIYVDVTFGGGGHSAEILNRFEKGRLIAFDQDQDALANVSADPRMILLPYNFKHLAEQLNANNYTSIDGILADLGVSSHQFDVAGRGFSIRFNAELDMRMNQSQQLAAKDIINYYPEHELVRVFQEYGELPSSKRMAAEIVRVRQEHFITTSDELKKTVSRFAPRMKENTFYAQLFQALRIEVNDELGALKELLLQAVQMLKKGGRLVVISYHSLEDRLVKNFLNSGNFKGEIDKDFYGHPVGLVFKSITRKPVVPSPEEVELNPRSRSAKMRIAERL